MRKPPAPFPATRSSRKVGLLTHRPHDERVNENPMRFSTSARLRLRWALLTRCPAGRIAMHQDLNAVSSVMHKGHAFTLAQLQRCGNVQAI
jgi:hypothetical protein